MKSEVCKRKVDKGDELIVGIWDAADLINKRKEQL
jgi:hypothetical protein